jgi:hypothetical protein
MGFPFFANLANYRDDYNTNESSASYRNFCRGQNVIGLWAEAKRLPDYWAEAETLPDYWAEAKTLPNYWAEAKTLPNYWAEAKTLPNYWAEAKTFPGYRTEPKFMSFIIIRKIRLIWARSKMPVTFRPSTLGTLFCNLPFCQR